MLAKRLDALPCGPKKPLQGRIRRVPASPLPRARISRWTASGNVRRYDWTASSGSVVANDPINKIDPSGLGECGTGSRIEGGGATCKVMQGFRTPAQKAAQTETANAGRASMREQAEMTMTLPVDPDGGSGARAAAGLIIVTGDAAEARRSGETLFGSLLVALGLGQQSKPPPGSKPINQTEWSGDHQEIKRGVGAGPADSVKISPSGDVWTQETDGTWSNHGPAKDYTGSGRASGRTGNDRRSNRRGRR